MFSPLSFPSRAWVMLYKIIIYCLPTKLFTLAVLSFEDLNSGSSSLQDLDQVQLRMSNENNLEANRLKAEQEELQHKNQVKSAFRNYSRDLQEDHCALLADTPLNAFYQANRERKALMLEEAIQHNQHFLNLIIDYIDEVEEEQSKPDPLTTSNNRSKIKTTLKQFYREWCDEGTEKDDFKRIVATLGRFLKKGDNVLVPGCGLGRLVYELVRAGFGAEGNEVTYFMLFGSNFIINAAQQKRQFKIFPFISSAYYRDEEDQFRSILIPDESPSQEMGEEEQPNFCIAAGQFSEVYGQRPSYFQGMATCFFLDTANNVFEYVDTICTTLKPGGVWANFGPLLFHYRDMQEQVSVEVSWEVLRAYIAKSFTFAEEAMVQTTYCHDPKSDMGVTYNCISFVAIRKSPES